MFITNLLSLNWWSKGFSANHDAIEAFSATAGAIFSIVLSLSTVFLWRETRRAARASGEQAELTRENIELAKTEFIASHRPKIRIRRVLISGDLLPASTVRVLLQVANVGDVDVAGFSIVSDVFVRGLSFKPTPQDHIGQVSVPTGVQRSIVIESAEVLPAFSFHGITQQQRLLCAVGEISYWDANNVMRATSFFRAYDVKLKRFVRVSENDPDSDLDYED